MMVACNNIKNGTSSNDEHSEADSIAHPVMQVEEAVMQDTVEENLEAATEETYSSPFDGVEMWKITLTAVTTIFNPVSAEEAKRIEANGDEDYWVDYDEEERQWYVHEHAEVEVGNVTITDAKWVNRLNQLMQKSKYDEYKQDVTIRGKVAYAKWYEGNRGGGIEDDFPKDLAKYINSLRR